MMRSRKFRLALAGVAACLVMPLTPLQSQGATKVPGGCIAKSTSPSITASCSYKTLTGQFVVLVGASATSGFGISASGLNCFPGGVFVEVGLLFFCRATRGTTVTLRVANAQITGRDV